MIFSSEQPQTGMNEGTWFTQGMCIKNEGYSCGRGDVWGRVKKKEGNLWRFPSFDMLQTQMYYAYR